MLADEVIQLLTAYVDGELTQRQRKAVGRLLHGSPEARALLAQLYDDAQKVRQLPRHKLVPGVAPQVVHAIVEQGIHITRPPVPIARRRWMPYVAAMAASILLAAVGGSLYYLAETNEDEPIVANGAPAPAPMTPKRATPERETPPRKRNPLIAQVVEGVYSQYAAPIPPERPQIYSVAFRDLKEDLVASGLASELDSDRSVQLDITVKSSNALALERLQRVLEENEIKVVVDPKAKQAAKKNEKVEYLVYAENLRADELTRILRELGRDDKALQKFQKSPFDKLSITPLTAKEKKHVSELLHTQPEKIDMAPETKKVEAPKFKRWEREAVVLPPTQTARPSTEVQSFVNQRKPQPGTLQVLLRIRQEK
jgi:hypothetical protein